VIAPSSVNGLPESEYDIVVAMNQGLINRFLDLSAKRGFFTNFPTGEAGKKPKFVTLVNSPIALFQESQEKMIKAEVLLKPPLSMLAKIAVSGDAVIGLDIYVKLAVTPAGAKLVFDSIGTNYRLDDKYIRAGILKGIVQGKIASAIAEVNEGFKKKAPSFEIPFPTAIGGIPVKIKDVQIKKEGYLNIYYEFGDEFNGT
jgi:hypothetical protein